MRWFHSEEVTLSGNLAADGGGIYNYSAGVATIATVAISNSTLSGNVASGHGGAIYNRVGSLLARELHSTTALLAPTRPL